MHVSPSRPIWEAAIGGGGGTEGPPTKRNKGGKSSGVEALTDGKLEHVVEHDKDQVGERVARASARQSEDLALVANNLPPGRPMPITKEIAPKAHNAP